MRSEDINNLCERELKKCRLEDRLLKTAAQLIKVRCLDTTNCEDCIFNDDFGCKISDAPNEWEV